MLLPMTLLLALVPQGEVRGVGRVLDRSGAPVANATVTFLSRPIPRALDAGPEDRRVVETDERGMFRVELARSVRYTAWASWDTAATALAEGVLAGEFVELRGVFGTGPVTLDLPGVDAWPESDTFTLRAVVGGENIDFAAVERDGDKWRVPALPRQDYRTIEVIDARGEVLWADMLEHSEDADGELVLPPPAEYDVAVSDPDGAAVAGVDVRWHIRNYWYSESASLPYGDRFQSLWPVVATTDAKGRARIRVARPEREKDLWLMSCKDGYRMSLDGITRGLPFQDGKVNGKEPQPQGETIAVTLRPAEPLVVPLSIDGTTPVADQWLYAVCRVHVSHGNGASGTPITMALPVKDGAARFLHPLPPGADVEIAEFVLADGLARSLQEQHGFRPRSVWRVPDPEKLLASDGPELIAPRLTRVLQVSAADGRPASRAVVLVGDQKNQRQAMLRTDRLGRVLLSVDRELKVGVLSEHGIGMVDVQPDGKGLIPLQLSAMVPLTVRVSDAEGKPAAGIGVRFQSFAGRDDDTADLMWCASSVLILRSRVPSDDKGLLELLLPPVECSVQFNCNRLMDSGKDLDWDPKSTEVHELVVRPPS